MSKNSKDAEFAKYMKANPSMYRDCFTRPVRDPILKMARRMGKQANTGPCSPIGSFAPTDWSFLRAPIKVTSKTKVSESHHDTVRLKIGPEADPRNVAMVRESLERIAAQA